MQQQTANTDCSRKEDKDRNRLSIEEKIKWLIDMKVHSLPINQRNENLNRAPFFPAYKFTQTFKNYNSPHELVCSGADTLKYIEGCTRYNLSEKLVGGKYEEPH